MHQTTPPNVYETGSSSTSALALKLPTESNPGTTCHSHGSWTRAFVKKPVKVEVALNHNYEEEGNDTIVEESANNRSVVDPQMLNMLKDLRQKIAKANNLPT